MGGQSPVERYEYIRRASPAFAQRIREAAREAHNEEEFRYAMNQALAGVAERAL